MSTPGYIHFTEINLSYLVPTKKTISEYVNMKNNPFIKKIICKHCNGTGKVKKSKLCIRCRGGGFWLKSLDEKVVTVCKSCHGTGCKNSYFICRDCNGFCYTDWLEKIIVPEEREIFGILKMTKDLFR